MLRLKILQISAQNLAGFSLEHKDLLAFCDIYPIVNVNKRNFGIKIIKSSRLRLVTQVTFRKKIFSSSPDWL